MQQFTGNRDTDKLILSYLDDADLISFIQVNKYMYSLCDDQFCKNRFISRYKYIREIDYLLDENWKYLYINQIIYIEKLFKLFKFKYSNESTGKPKDYYNILWKYIIKKSISYNEFYSEAWHYKDLINFIGDRWGWCRGI